MDRGLIEMRSVGGRAVFDNEIIRLELSSDEIGERFNKMCALFGKYLNHKMIMVTVERDVGELITGTVDQSESVRRRLQGLAFGHGLMEKTVELLFRMGHNKMIGTYGRDL